MTSPTTITITPATFPKDLSTVQRLFTTYTSSLNLDLSFQSYAEEYSSLPGAYTTPSGNLFLASTSASTIVGSDDDIKGERVLGCVAVRSLGGGGGVCEMKRLYVCAEGRGLGVGRALVAEAVGWARGIGYRVMKLDTLPDMREAQRLYASLGFKRCEACCENPVQGVVFMELHLTGGDGGAG